MDQDVAVAGSSNLNPIHRIPGYPGRCLDLNLVIRANILQRPKISIPVAGDSDVSRLTW